MPTAPTMPHRPESDARGIHIRRATAADSASAAPLFDAYRTFYGKPPDVEAARAFLSARLERGESVVLLAIAREGKDETVVGFAQLYRTFSSLSLGRIVVLNDLFVVPAARGQAVGRRLVEESAAFAAQDGACRLELATQHTNAAALALYGSLGFTPDSEFTHLSLTVGVTGREENE